MFVTYRGYRIERFARHRVDVRNADGDLLKMTKTWNEAIGWVDDQTPAPREKNHERAEAHTGC